MNKLTIISSLLISLLIISIISSVALGAYTISIHEITTLFLNGIGITDTETSFQSYSIFWHIRLPRVCFGLLIGSTLSVAGAGLQGLFRNPLADPGLVGISSGAVLFTALFIVFGFQTSNTFLHNFGLSFFTFFGATLTTFLIFKLASRNNTTNVANMLLAGIAINALCSSGTGFLFFLAEDDQLRDLTFWTLGSLGGASWDLVLTLLPIALITIVFIPSLAKKLDAFTLGEEDAECLGVNVQKMKITLIILVALGVGVCVAFSGTIGFVGLVVPHIIRLTIGSNHYALFILSAILGGTLLCFADLACRLLVVPAELPIGILTAILGTPMFLFLLISQNKKTASYV